MGPESLVHVAAELPVAFEGPLSLLRFPAVIASPEAAVPVLLTLFGMLGMGLADWIRRETNGEGATDAGDAGDIAFDDGGLEDDFADFGDDPFDDLEADLDDGDDPLGAGNGPLGGGAGSAAVDEIQNRVDELETELTGISSTMSTVRSENEAIGESVEEIEDNVRRLLEIYEAVTQGVNPFSDTPEGPNAGALSLFGDDAADGGNGTDDADTAADALDGFAGDPDGATFAEDDDVFADDVADPADAGDDDVETGSGDGLSFEDLKAEYAEEGTDWDGDAFEDGVEGTSKDEAAVESDGGSAAAEAGDRAAGTAPEEDSVGGFEFGDAVADATTVTETQAAEGRSSHAPSVEPEGDLRFAENTLMASRADSVGRPYLADLPPGYTTDLVVLEWLEFLVSRGGAREAARAIRYYVDLGWLGEDSGRALEVYLRGFDRPPGEDGDGPEALTVAHHTRSLLYINRLAGDPGLTTLGPSSAVGGGGGGI